MQKIQLPDGHQLSVRCVGRGQPVVLLHGFASQSAHWLFNILPLAHRFRFIMPDFRGFGGSHHVPITTEDVFEQYADDVHAVVEHFGLEKFVIGGISTGAMVALTYNQRHGFGRVSHYLHIECAPRSDNGDDWQWGLFSPRQDVLFSRFNHLIEMAEAAGLDTPYWELPKDTRLALKNMLGRAVGLAVDRKIARRIAYLASVYGESLLADKIFPVTHWKVYLQVLQAFMRGHNMIPTLSSIKVPTTLMIGENSRFFPAAGQHYIKQHIGHADIVSFENSGHIPILDQPIKFQSEFRRFLLQTTAQKRSQIQTYEQAIASPS